MQKITPTDTLFTMVDMQDRFRDIIHNMDAVVKNSDILCRASEILDIPLIVTEQSPEKLGKTIADIYVPTHAKLFTKTKFSAFTEELSAEVKRQGKPHIVVFGIETHVCITQTCLDALRENYKVLLVADAVSSRTKENKKIALKMLAHKTNLEVVSTEMLLFRLLDDATHLKFREISKLVK